MITRDVYARAQDMRSRGITAAEVSRSLGISRSAVYQIGRGTYPLARRESVDRDELRRQSLARKRARCDVRCCPADATGARRAPHAVDSPETQTALNSNLGDLLPLRLANYLETRDIHSLHDVLQSTCEQLLAIPGIGKKSLALILAVLDRHGFDTRKAWRFVEQHSNVAAE